MIDYLLAIAPEAAGCAVDRVAVRVRVNHRNHYVAEILADGVMVLNGIGATLQEALDQLTERAGT